MKENNDEIKNLSFINDMRSRWNTNNGIYINPFLIDKLFTSLHAINVYSNAAYYYHLLLNYLLE